MFDLWACSGEYASVTQEAWALVYVFLYAITFDFAAASFLLVLWPMAAKGGKISWGWGTEYRTNGSCRAYGV